jgi:hypothetical protein
MEEYYYVLEFKLDQINAIFDRKIFVKYWLMTIA